MLHLLVAAALAVLAARFFYADPLTLAHAWTGRVEQAASAKGLQVIDTAAAQIIVETYSHLVLDARRESDFLSGHIPGAMSLPANAIDEALVTIAMLLTPEQPVLVYCSGQDCDESIMVGEALVQSGFTNITLYVGGLKAWQEAGLPVSR